MKVRLRVVGLGSILALLLSGTNTTVCPAATMALTSSPQIPAAEGKARLHKTKNGNIEIKIAIKHLAPPERIVPGANVFMVWVRGLAPDAQAQNLGALRVDKKLNAKMTAITALPSFDLFITCEPSQAVTTPGSPELLPLHYVNER
jgi:hypothetical protein